MASRYKLIATLDTTGIAHLYLAWDEQEERWVSLKILSTKWVNDERVRSRFKNECETLKRVAHHSVLGVLDEDHDDIQMPRIVLEVAEGGNIEAWVADNGPMEPYLAIKVMAALCSALDKAHLVGVEHGELVPDNLLIDRHGAVKVSGFRGSASFGNEISAFNDTADAGEILYFLLSGKRFDEKKKQDFIEGLDPILAPIVDKGTRRKRRGNRYAGVMALSRELEAAILHLPVPDRPPADLATKDCWLPDDWRRIFDPKQEWPDLEVAQLMIDDPFFVPEASELNVYDQITKLQSGATEGGESTGDNYSDNLIYKPIEGPLYQEPLRDEDADWLRSKSAKAEDADEVRWHLQQEEQRKKIDASRIISNFALFRLLAVTMIAGFVVLIITLGLGAFSVHNARSAANEAGDTLVKVVEAEGSVLYTLSAAGGDRKELEKLYFEYSDAHSTQKIRPAAEFARFVISEARRNEVDSLAGGGETSRAVGEIEHALRFYEGEVHKWDQKTTHFPGSVAAFIGLASKPE